MSARKKVGMLVLLCCMAVLAAALWYCLLTVGRSSSHVDGTFVMIPAARGEMAMPV